MKTVTQTKLRNDITSLFKEVSDTKEALIVSRQQGLPLAVVNYEEYLEFKQFKERKRG